MFVSSGKKAITIVNSLSCDLKKNTLKNAGQCYIYPSHVNNFFKGFFFNGADLKFEIGHNGEKYSLKNTSQVQNTEFVG